MGSLTVATTGIVSGLANNQQINSIVAAAATMSEGASAPTPASTGLTSTAGLLWHDTTNNLIKLRDQADANWIPYFFVDETNKIITPIVRGALFGFTLSNDGVAPNTKLNIAAGFATDDSFSGVISKASGTLSIDCTTTGAGGLDTGSLVASKSYHAWAIGKADGTSAGFANRDDLSGLSPTLPTGYIFKRRLGSFRTDSLAHIIPTTQDGDEFLLTTSIDENSGAAFIVGTGASLLGLTAPTGIKLHALFHATFNAPTGNFGLLTSPDEADQAPSNQRCDFNLNSAGQTYTTGSRFNRRTNTSAQIRARSSVAGASLFVSTYGWIDTRGRLA